MDFMPAGENAKAESMTPQRLRFSLLLSPIVTCLLLVTAGSASAEPVLRKGCDGNAAIWLGDWLKNPDKLNSPFLYEGFYGCCKTWHGYPYCETWNPLETRAVR